MVGDLDGKTILVIGATGGIGLSCAALCVRRGALVVATGRRAATIDAAKAKWGDMPIRPVLLDLEDASSWSIEGAVFDGVVFAAGMLSVKPLRAQPEAEFQRIMRINFEAPALLTRNLLRQKQIADGGSVVFIGSIAGRIGALGHTAYSSSKAALAGFTRSLAVEVASRGVRVNTISPGLVETEMAAAAGNVLTEEQRRKYAADYPLGLGRAEDVAEAVAFLLGGGSRWITGIDLVVDGGISHT